MKYIATKKLILEILLDETEMFSLVDGTEQIADIAPILDQYYLFDTVEVTFKREGYSTKKFERLFSEHMKYKEELKRKDEEDSEDQMPDL